jgi:CBS domain containing-hemolysin-like protein
MEKITSKGYSRIVVHREGNRNDLMGTVRMRDLLKGIDG